MVSPLSPFLAEIFINYVETIVFNSNYNFFKNIIYWGRYIDAILCIYIGFRRQVQMFVNDPNNFNKFINFTVEHEVNHSINFLL